MKKLLAVLMMSVGVMAAQTKPVATKKAVDSCAANKSWLGGGTDALGTYHFYQEFGVNSFFPELLYEKCVDGHWVKDADAQGKYEEDIRIERQKSIDHQKHLADLWDALITRVISDDELREVLEVGMSIVPAKDGGVPDTTESNNAALVFQNALLTQVKIRLLHSQANTLAVNDAYKGSVPIESKDGIRIDRMSNEEYAKLQAKRQELADLEETIESRHGVYLSPKDGRSADSVEYRGQFLIITKGNSIFSW